MTTIVRRIAALSIAAAFLTAPAAPVQAAETEADVHGCTQGHYCLFSEKDFHGKKKETVLQPHACYQPNVDWGDGTTSRPGSIVNNRGERSQLEAFDNDSCSGQPYGLLRFTQSVPTVSDRAKSFRVAPLCDIGNVCLYENKDFSGTMWQV